MTAVNRDSLREGMAGFAILPRNPTAAMKVAAGRAIGSVDLAHEAYAQAVAAAPADRLPELLGRLIFAEARADRLSAEVEALRDALKPFAVAVAGDHNGWPDKAVICRGITFGHLRAARTALARAAVKAETEGGDHG